MRRHIVPLFAANAGALAIVGLSYLLYSRLLTAEQFGVYSAALAVGTLATLVLDGGVKVSLIKHATPAAASEERALLHLMLGFSLVLLGAMLGLRGVVAHFYPVLTHEAGFVAGFTGIYLLTYPWIGLPTAQLERRLAYSRLAWIESIGLVLERGAPVLFLYFTGLGMYAFVVSLALGRLVRVAALAHDHPVPLGRVARGTYGSVLNLVREGAWYQVGSGSSLLRDNLHLLIIGPLFGSAWVGYYAWGLQLCVMASQVFVQISARVSLPIAAQGGDFQDRWRTVVRQVGPLTAITAPVLAGVLWLAPPAIHQLFAGRWSPALALLPYLFLRMLPGAASAPIGALTLVERGARIYALTMWLWTLVELGMGMGAVKWLGVEGLAVSYSLGAWVGLACLLFALRRNTGQLLLATATAILVRPTLWASVALGLLCELAQGPGRDWLSRVDLVWAIATVAALVACLYAADAELRSTLLRWKGGN